MREPMTGARPRRGQEGFSLVTILGIVAVLSIAGGLAFKNVKADINYSGKDLDRVRADFLAESAIHLALAELAKGDGTGLPYTKATHANDSWHRLPDHLPGGEANPRKLDRTRMIAPYPAKILESEEGWVFIRNVEKARSVTGAALEEMSFMVWYPDDNTLRITGRGVADKTTSTVSFKADMRDVLVPR